MQQEAHHVQLYGKVYFTRTAVKPIPTSTPGPACTCASTESFVIGMGTRRSSTDRQAPVLRFACCSKHVYSQVPVPGLSSLAFR